MIRLRLFHRQDPARQIDSRVLDEGELSIGRGIKADWQVSDPERDLSRLHMTLAVREGMLTVRDTSANGVFVGNPRSRLEQDRPTPVSRGESIVFGPYLLVAEEDAAARVPDPAPILDDDPFGGPDDRAPATPVPGRDPFGSALRPDPVKLDEEPGDGVDAWERKRAYKAGDWDPVAPHRRPDHSQLIGTPQDWTTPPQPAEREHGLGFDAPFTSPILREQPADAGAVAIPSDWDAVTPTAASNPAANPFTDTPAATGPVLPLAHPAEDEFAPDTDRPTDPAARSATGGAIIEDADPILPPRGTAAAPIPDDPFSGTPFAGESSPANAPTADADHARGKTPAAPAVSSDGPDFAREPLPQAAPLPAPQSSVPSPQVAGDDTLFESFCAGARLSPNAFAGEDRALLMERLGAVYRQAILGVADLMSERTALKNDFRMVRTTIRPQNNNPFKWVPPQRIAIELLRTDDGSGYSTGEAALNEALHDVKAHMLCVLAGMRGAIGATFDLLAPSEIEARTANRGFVMPGQRSAAAWSEYVDQYAAQRREADDSAEGPINRAFRQAYEDQSKALDGKGR